MSAAALPLHRRLSSSVLRHAFCLGCVLPLAAAMAINDNTAGSRGVPTTTWPAGTLLAELDNGGRQATFHRGWLYVLCTNNRVGPNTVWNIADPTTPELVDSRPVGGNGHRFFHIGDCFSRAYSVPELSLLADEDKLLPDGSRSRFLDLGDVPGRIAWLDPMPFPVDRNAGGTMDWPYRFRKDGLQDYNSRDVLAEIDWGATAGISEVGQSVLIGNLYLVSGAQKGGGPIAAYDVGDPTRPQLLDSLPIHLNAYVGGNVQVYGHYFVVLGAPSIIDGQAYNCVGIDFSDPTDLQIAWAYKSSQIPGRYMEHQDHWGFTNGRKIDMRRVIAGDEEVTELRFTEGKTDFVSLPVGHLLVASGSNSSPGKTYIYSHQDELDTTPPTVAYHLPADGADNLPTTSNIGLVIHETLDATTVTPEQIELRPVGGAPIETLIVMYDYDVIHIAPVGDLEPNTTYELRLRDGQVKDVAGNAMAGYSFQFSTGEDGDEPPVVASTSLDPTGPIAVGTTVAFDAEASDPEGATLEYRWDFGDAAGRERSRSEWSTDAGVSHRYDRPGNFTVVLQVRDDHHHLTTVTRQLVVTEPVDGPPPAQSSSLCIDSERRRVWVCEPDNDLVVRLDADSGERLGPPTPVDDHPLAVIVDADGDAWVACRDSDSLVEVAGDSGAVSRRLQLGYGSRPVALVADPTRPDRAYLSQAGRARIVVVDTAAGSVGEAVALDRPAEPGLVALYYDDADLGDFFARAVVDTVDFDWADTAPLSGMRQVDAFSIRFVGSIVAPVSEIVTFTCRTRGDSTRLWIGGEQVIDDWNPWGNSASGEIALVAGERYSFMLEFTDPGGDAELQLTWSSASLEEAVVPAEALSQPISAHPRPRALAVSGDGATLLVTQFLSEDLGGMLWRIDPATLGIQNRIHLPLDATTTDGTANGRGVANLLTSVAIAPQGDRAWLPAVKDNIRRGQFRDEETLDFETTLRALVCSVDLQRDGERADRRVDIDNHGQPSAVCYSPSGNHLVVSMQGNHRIVVLDARTGGEVVRADVGIAPQAVAVDPATDQIWVHDFLSRQVSRLDGAAAFQRNAAELALLGQTVLLPSDDDVLEPAVLRGKQLFYSARDLDDPAANPSRMTLDGYISCAACHLDGGHDYRVWDFTDRGEGLRNTISLRGRRGTGHGPVHWTANFDEIHDFEHDIRGPFGGSGFLSDEDFDSGTRNTPLGDPKAGLSDDLDALAAYVGSLSSYPRSPHRTREGGLTMPGLHGKVLFQRLDCSSCHSGPDFTDSAAGVRHDVGTMVAHSGQRLGAALDGIDTPTLKGIWATAPYLHDGSAETLAAVFDRAAPDSDHGRVQELSDDERGQLIAYLQQIDGAEAAAPSGTRRLRVWIEADGAADSGIETGIEPDFSTDASEDAGIHRYDGLPRWLDTRVHFDRPVPEGIGLLPQGDASVAER